MNNEIKKRQSIVEAAANVFLRHGYAQSTMGLIAEAAQMSRPALYLVFGSKDEIFSATVQDLTEKLVTDLKARAKSRRTKEEKLLFICCEWAKSTYQIHRDNDAAKDMDDLSLPGVREVYEAKTNLIAEVLNPTKPSSARTLAHTLTYALRGCRLGAQSMEEMEKMARLLIKSVYGSAKAKK